VVLSCAAVRCKSRALMRQIHLCGSSKYTTLCQHMIMLTLRSLHDVCSLVYDLQPPT